MAVTTIPTEADILAELVQADQGDLGVEAAQAILALRFNRRAEKRINELLRKNNRGTITTDERLILERYLRVGQFLDLLQARARLSLQGESN